MNRSLTLRSATGCTTQGRNTCARMALLVLAESALLPATAVAQAFPARALRIVVPFAPGGRTDTLTRLLAPKMSEILGQQVVVENRGGAASQIGTELVARAAPNGYTLLAVDTSFASNPSLFARLPYDALKDFSPIALLAAAPVALVIHPSVPAKSLKELLALAKSRPAASAARPTSGSRSSKPPAASIWWKFPTRAAGWPPWTCWPARW